MFAVIFIPDFALQAALRHLPHLREQPVGLIPEKTARARLLQCTVAARQAGASPGMTPSQAHARCPEMQVLIRSPEAERCAQAAVLDCATAFSAYVENTAEGICTLELTRSRDLQPQQLVESALSQLARLHLSARIGFAPNADLALLAAQSTDRWREVRAAGELGGLPLESLAFPPPMRELLHRWGIWSLGAFAALGQEALSERLGPEVLPLLAQAQGRVERPLRCIRPAETYEESVEFEHEYETLDPLLFVIRRLLEQITLRLETTYLVAAHLTLRLGFAHGAGEHERIFKIPAPTARVEVLYRALETYLEKFTAKEPINRLQLIATPCRPARQQFSLFENALRDPNQFFETLARLIALLGQDRVGVPVVEDTHKPDSFRVGEVDLDQPTSPPKRRPRSTPAPSKAGVSPTAGMVPGRVGILPAPAGFQPARLENGIAQTDVPAPPDTGGHRFVGASLISKSASGTAPSHCIVPFPTSPTTHGRADEDLPLTSSGSPPLFTPTPLLTGLCLRRFRPPIPAEVELGHERQPVFLTTAALRGRALEALGPMHISGAWWDNQAWHRFEWDLELIDGTLCRVCQESGKWSLEGVYD